MEHILKLNDVLLEISGYVNLIILSLIISMLGVVGGSSFIFMILRILNNNKPIYVTPPIFLFILGFLLMVSILLFKYFFKKFLYINKKIKKRVNRR